ncbi:MAG: TIM barrel protein [Candidatus Choladocola sp.]|nr:TIM barrel protein [Candidatus Choladocola sp.]
MALLISTNMYKAEDLKRVLPYLKRFDYKVGVEIFPMFHETEYKEILQECLMELKKVPISFHGPYYGAEHSIPGPDTENRKNGNPEAQENKAARYKKTMEMMQETIEYGQYLKARYIVYHHNNCRVRPENREEMIRVSCENFREVEKMAEDIPVVVENAGVLSRGNMLFDQEEFIRLCKKENYKVLIDIGHAHANGWDLECVMEALKERIVAYHIHNNDGIYDSHRRIHDGTIDFEKFRKDCRRLTPEADLVLEYSPEVGADVQGIEGDIEELIFL